MLHGPCGTLNPGSVCTIEGKCTKGFPKPYEAQTKFDLDKPHPIYKRRATNQGGMEVI